MEFYKGKPVYNRLKLFIISLLVGVIGIDRIYIGDYTKGLIKFITLGGLGIWYFIDVFHIGVGNKISNVEYYWKCDIDSTCKAETNMIFKIAMWFIVISVVVVLYFYPRNINSSKIMKHEDETNNI